MKLRFIIAAPRYSHQSGGIMILHELCDMLNRQGYESTIVLFHGANKPPYQWAYSNDLEFYHPDFKRISLSMENPDKSVRDFLENGVVIYPDLIPDNPLGASRVVRYILYKNKDYVASSKNEYVLSFSKMYHENPNSYLFKVFTDPDINSRGSELWSKRTLDLTYFGKGPAFIECFRIPDTLLMTRSWPEDKNQLGILLRQCRYFFTWDSVSSTNMDAIVCGAIPVLLHDKQVSKNEIDYGELGALPNASLVDLNNKESVFGCATEITDQADSMNAIILQYENTWPERVRQFAIDVSIFFEVAN